MRCKPDVHGHANWPKSLLDCSIRSSTTFRPSNVVRSAASTDYWDRVAERYARSPIRDGAVHQRMIERTRRYLGPGDHVLDLGCATGANALLLAPYAERFTAIDISHPMISVARGNALRQGIKNVRFTQADMYRFEVEPGGFDAVLAIRMLHLVEDLPAMLKRIKSLLGPNGVFVSQTVCLAEKSAYLKPFISMLRAFRGAPHLSFLEGDALNTMLKAEGFEILECSPLPKDPPTRFIVARKL